MNPIEFNQSAWNRLAQEGNRFFHAIKEDQLESARSGNPKIRVTPQKFIPLDWLVPLAGRQVLCLAGGGGQQGPLLAAAGAEVTVFDLSPDQLTRDAQAAEKFGLNLAIEVGDMADLSRFEDQTFDLIVNPCSICYCPDPHPIWREAYRVCKSGGKLIAGLIQPLYYVFDAVEMDKGNLVARHQIPYSDLDLAEDERQQIMGELRPLEYGHSLNDLIGGQLNAGFHLTGMFEDGWGSNDRLSSLIATFLATSALRPT